MRKKLLILLMSMIFNTFGFVVFDPTNFGELIKSVEQMKEQYDQLVKQYDLLKNQYDTAKDTLNTAESTLKSLQGSRNISDILNSVDDIKNREWLDSDWQNTLRNIAGGNDERYKDLYTQYVKTHPNLSSDDYSKSHTPEDTQAYTEQSQTTTAVAVIGQKEFSRINEQIEQLKALGDQIDKTADLKASSDLNARMTQQLGYIMAEIVRMQTAIINLEVVSNAQVVRAKSDTDKFFSHKE